ncbi:hypothetical protein AaE_000082 [Aphanomyces astaci]|uniref:CST complex subunit STN1 n=1 Tax=Aphanomyces astaci TaxID=112090 RepID=A0A6A5AWS3_APHAT|nr:hypothetical protein AaE_000082 [Aphanomyces astaci]
MDPLNWSHVKLLVCHIHREVEQKDMFFRLRGRIVTRVHLVGWITSMQPRAGRVEYMLDDGSGEVNLVKWEEAMGNVLALGDVVRVQGKLKRSTWSNAVEVTISKVVLVTDPNEEVLHWMEVRHLFLTVYLSTPCEHATPQLEREERPVQAFLRQVFLGTADDIVLPTTDEDHFACSVALFLHRRQQATQPPPNSPIRFRFHELVKNADEMLQVPNGAPRITAFRRAFTVLRKAGLCHLEDADNDVYCFVTLPAALQPWIVGTVRDEGETSVSHLVSKVVQLKLFRHLSLDWIAAAIDELSKANVLSATGTQISIK